MKYYRHDKVLDIRFSENEAVALRNWLDHLKPDENGTVAGNLLHILKTFPSMQATENEEDLKHNVSPRVTGSNYCPNCGIGNGGLHRPHCMPGE